MCQKERRFGRLAVVALSIVYLARSLYIKLIDENGVERLLFIKSAFKILPRRNALIVSMKDCNNDYFWLADHIYRAGPKRPANLTMIN